MTCLPQLPNLIFHLLPLYFLWVPLVIIGPRLQGVRFFVRDLLNAAAYYRSWF